MDRCDREFSRRAARLPAHGLGLSVDVYTPELLELYGALAQAGLKPDYLEVFKAPAAELARIRQALPETRFAYHAEGVWLIDPEMRTNYPWVAETQRMARHARTLGAAWINHECASKQFAGYSFGTYLPPLLTCVAAEVTAANAELCQQLVDHSSGSAVSEDAPLLLLELPPLTYFGFGDLSVAEFFTHIAGATPCGFVLDIGHLWTQWRYREHARHASLESFADAFLDEFPLHRVIQIHLAGLDSVSRTDESDISRWIDTHNAPVPRVLWSLLGRVLAHPGLSALKGIALEVDTKAIALITEEFGQLRERYGMPRPGQGAYRSFPAAQPRIALSPAADLAGMYGTYAQVVAGQHPMKHSALEPLAEDLDCEGLRQYSTVYLPNELHHWGGDLEELFPKITRVLKERGVGQDDFVRFWFRQPYAIKEPYDFFYIKLDRWIEFVRERAPDLSEEAQREAMALRRLHAEFNDEPVTVPGS
jgi:sugar phosphate isomerase/epimerase